MFAIVPVVDRPGGRSSSTTLPHWFDRAPAQPSDPASSTPSTTSSTRSRTTSGTATSRRRLRRRARGRARDPGAILANAFVVTVLTLYFLASLPSIKHAALPAWPRPSRRERVSLLGDQHPAQHRRLRLRRLRRRVLRRPDARWSSCSSIGLGSYAVALALVVALLDVIPMIGATIGAFIVCGIAFATDLKSRHRLRGLLHRLPAGRELRDLPAGDGPHGRRSPAR